MHVDSAKKTQHATRTEGVTKLPSNNLPVSFMGAKFKLSDDPTKILSKLREAGAKPRFEDANIGTAVTYTDKGVLFSAMIGFGGGFKPELFQNKSNEIESIALVSGNKNAVGFKELVIGRRESRLRENIPVSAEAKAAMSSGMLIGGTKVKVKLGDNIDAIAKALDVKVNRASGDRFGNPIAYTIEIEQPGGRLDRNRVIIGADHRGKVLMVENLKSKLTPDGGTPVGDRSQILTGTAAKPNFKDFNGVNFTPKFGLRIVHRDERS